LSAGTEQKRRSTDSFACTDRLPRAVDRHVAVEARHSLPDRADRSEDVTLRLDLGLGGGFRGAAFIFSLAELGVVVGGDGSRGGVLDGFLGSALERRRTGMGQCTRSYRCGILTEDAAEGG
jgi:hypothetical protein